MNKRNSEQIVEKYLLKVFGPDNKPQNALSNFSNQVLSKITCNLNYLHAHPLVVQWGIASECNLRCIHCFYAEKQINYDKSNDLSTQQALKLIDDFDEMNIYSINLTGGEIFTRKDIFEIINKIKSKNMILYIQTNGTLIDKKIAKQLWELLVPGVDIVQVSLESVNKNTNEMIRGKGSYHKAIQSIKNLVSNNILTYVNCTATSLNIEGIPDLYRMTSELGVRNFSVNKFKCPDMTQEYLNTEFEKRLQIVEKLFDIENETTHLEISLLKIYELISKKVGLEFIEKILETTIDYNGKNIACQKHDRLYIKGNGNVYACAASEQYDNDDFCMGNIKDKSLIDIWNNRHHNILFHEKLYDNFPCKNCKYFTLCMGGCAIEAIKKYKTINAPDGNCPFGEKLMEKVKIS